MKACPTDKKNIYNNVSKVIVIISKAIQNYYLIQNSSDNTVQFQLNFRVLWFKK